jgi:hypothetical protein
MIVPRIGWLKRDLTARKQLRFGHVLRAAQRDREVRAVAQGSDQGGTSRRDSDTIWLIVEARSDERKPR